MLMPPAPNMKVRRKPITVKVAIIPSEYTPASNTDRPRLPVSRLVKNETVIGIMGNTHGVSNASAPMVMASHI